MAYTILGPLKGVYRVDEPVLKLKQDVLGWWVVVSQHILEDAGWDEIESVQSGPYRLKSHAEAELEKLL